MRNSRAAVMVIVVVLLLGTVFSGAMAQDRAKSFVLTPAIGGYIFDSDQHINSDPVFGIGLGYNYNEKLGVEAVFDYIDTDLESTTQDQGVEALVYRIDGLYHFMLEKDVLPYVAIGAGAISIDTPDSDDTDFLVNYGGGIKYFLTDKLSVRGDIRHVISFDDTNNNLIYTVGLSYLLGKKAPPPPPDSDGDGVPDDRDKCPGTPAGVKVDNAGCPLDSDGDGVYDYLDKCPDTPSGATVDSKGCQLDSDGDGVFDDHDKCPGTPAGVKVDNAGCPLDSDGDGVYDYLDKCPDTPSGAAVDSKGCQLDSDGDGVYDYMDACPGTLKGIPVDSKGCPLPIKEKVSIELKVEFDFDSAVIKNIYHDHIQKVVNFLKTYPETTATIEGHTDSKGSEKYNLRLSRKRAENVMKELIHYGIDPARLKAVGYGESRPVADNSTKEGRQKNRRVVAVISTIITK